MSPSDPPATGAETVRADLVVLGGGMAGMSAAAFAARAGATVVVLERGTDIGGSAVLSGGSVWTPATTATALEHSPHGDPALIAALVADYPEAIVWLAGTGISVADRVSLEEIMGFPAVGHQIDVIGHMRASRSAVERAGGIVATRTTPRSLIIDDGAVVGVLAEDDDGPIEVRAPWVLLATGGFQNDPELRARHLGPGGADMLVRSNPNSDGTGLRMAGSAGAATSRHMSSFYGHAMPAPLSRALEPRDFLRLAQLYTTRGVLLDAAGDRIVDESISYHGNSRAIARAPGARALLVTDEPVIEADRTGYGLRSMEQIDRPVEAAREGARSISAPSLDELGRQVEAWSYRNVAKAVTEFNAALAIDPGALRPARERHRRPLTVAPFHAMEVQPAVTFTMGGVRIDPDCRVLDADGAPISGLLAAGADAGGLYHETYLGGLSMAVVFGLRAARTALGPVAPAANTGDLPSAERARQVR